MAAHARLINEFTEDEKYHNLMRWLKYYISVLNRWISRLWDLYCWSKMFKSNKNNETDPERCWKLSYLSKLTKKVKLAINVCCITRNSAFFVCPDLEHLEKNWPPEHWTASSEFGTYRLCEQRRFRRACASMQSRQNLRCSLIQAVSQEEPSDRKPDPWPLWMAGHAQLKFVMTDWACAVKICHDGLLEKKNSLDGLTLQYTWLKRGTNPMLPSYNCLTKLLVDKQYKWRRLSSKSPWIHVHTRVHFYSLNSLIIIDLNLACYSANCAWSYGNSHQPKPHQHFYI